jgi:hypothetical protein
VSATSLSHESLHISVTGPDGNGIGCGLESAWVNKKLRKRSAVACIIEKLVFIVVLGYVIADFGLE